MDKDNLKCVHADKVWVNPKDRNDYLFEYEPGRYPEILCRKTESYCDCIFHYTECILYDKWDRE